MVPGPPSKKRKYLPTPNDSLSFESTTNCYDVLISQRVFRIEPLESSLNIQSFIMPEGYFPLCRWPHTGFGTKLGTIPAIHVSRHLDLVNLNLWEPMSSHYLFGDTNQKNQQHALRYHPHSYPSCYWN